MPDRWAITVETSRLFIVTEMKVQAVGVPGVTPVIIELTDFKTKEVVDHLEVDAVLVATGRAPYTQVLPPRPRPTGAEPTAAATSSPASACCGPSSPRRHPARMSCIAPGMRGAMLPQVAARGGHR